MKQLRVRILQNKRIGADFYKIRVESAYLARNIKPGQFVNVRCSDSIEPLLRRPFSVHRILNDGMEMLYEVVGKGTEALSERKPGELLDIIGPLGNGFDTLHPSATYAVAEGQPRRLTRHYTLHILVAGGMGVAPLVALAEAIVHRTSYIVHREKVYVFIGAKKDSHILCEQEFESLGCEVMVATEDGSRGEKGLVTDLLKSLRSTKYERRTTIYACGPNAMLKEVARIAQARRIPCQVSLEENMACGIGVCLGCPVKVKTKYDVRSTMYEYKMACKDGPVFKADEIIF